MSTPGGGHGTAMALVCTMAHMPRFVLLRHECPPELGKPSHWDLMLEDEGALLTWSLFELPGPGGLAAFATRLDDHRMAYLEYEGPLSGERGSVSRVDAGEFEWVERTAQTLVVSFAGRQLIGKLTAQLIGGASWRLSFDAAGEGP
jgi:hypothetical protein